MNPGVDSSGKESRREGDSRSVSTRPVQVEGGRSVRRPGRGEEPGAGAHCHRRERGACDREPGVSHRRRTRSARPSRERPASPRRREAVEQLFIQCRPPISTGWSSTSSTRSRAGNSTHCTVSWSSATSQRLHLSCPHRSDEPVAACSGTPARAARQASDDTKTNEPPISTTLSRSTSHHRRGLSEPSWFVGSRRRRGADRRVELLRDAVLERPAAQGPPRQCSMRA